MFNEHEHIFVSYKKLLDFYRCALVLVYNVKQVLNPVIEKVLLGLLCAIELQIISIIFIVQD